LRKPTPQETKVALSVSGKAVSKLLGKYGQEFGFEYDSEGNFTIAGDVDLRAIKLQINSEGQVQFSGPGDISGGFTIQNDELNSAVVNLGVISINLSAYDNMVINYDITIGSPIGVKLYGGFDLLKWKPLKLINDQTQRSNDTVCHYIKKYC
jgi:hypothetical protein